MVQSLFKVDGIAKLAVKFLQQQSLKSYLNSRGQYLPQVTNTGSPPQATTQSIPCIQPCQFLSQTSLVHITATHNNLLAQTLRQAQSKLCMYPCPLSDVPHLALPATLNKYGNQWSLGEKLTGLDARDAINMLGKPWHPALKAWYGTLLLPVCNAIQIMAFTAGRQGLSTARLGQACALLKNHLEKYGKAEHSQPCGEECPEYGSGFCAKPSS